MKKVFFCLILIMILSLSFCTFHIPYDSEDSYYSPFKSYKIIFLVEPDDSKILLNGRVIGEAYEFSTKNSALKLTSRNNEIVVKKEGYAEEAIDLYQYNSRKITVKLQLHKDKGNDIDKERKISSLKEEKPEYIAKTEPPPKPLKESKKEIKEEFKIVNITLEIQPPESAIYLNGAFWGIAPENGKIENMKIKEGKNIIEVFKPDYKIYRKKINITDQKKVKIIIKLEKL